jgi:hypothetical protein
MSHGYQLYSLKLDLTGGALVERSGFESDAV